MAAGSSRDVELVIRARDEAGKAIASVSEALKTLAGIQDDVGQSAQKADGLLCALGASLSELQKEAQGLQALGTVAKQIDRATEAVSRLENSAQAAGASAAALGEKYEQLGQAGAQLSEKLGQTKAAVDNQRAAVAASEADQAKLTAEIERAGRAYNALLSEIKKAKEPNDALRQSYRDQRDTLVALNEQQSVGEKNLIAQREVLTETVRAYTNLNKEVQANTAAQERLERDVQTASESLERQQAALEKARGELAGMTDAGRAASDALGGVALSQDAIGQAAKATAESVAKVTEALARQKAAGGADTGSAAGPAASATQAYRDQIQAVREARAAWEQAQAAATKLGEDIAKTAEPSRQMTAAFNLAKAASAEAKQSFFDQGAALAGLKGVTQGGFSAFNQVAAAMEAEARAAHQAGQALRDLPDIAPQIKPLSASLRELLASLFQIPSAAGGAAAGIHGMGESSRDSFGFVERLRGEVVGLAASFVGLYAAAQQIGGVISSVAAVESAQARLAVVFDGNKKAASDELQSLLGEAERLGIPFSELATQYTKVAVAAKEMGFATESTRKVFIGLAEAGRVSGLQAHEMEGVFLGLRESIDRGTLNARNFNLEIGAHIPGAMKAMADAVGLTIPKFTELQRASGGIAANEETLSRFADNLKKEFGPELGDSLNTLNAQLGRLKTIFQEAQLSVGAGGFTEAFKSLIDDLDTLLKSSSGAEAFKDIGEALAGLTNVLDFAVKNFDTLVKVAQLFVGLKVASFVLGMVSANSALSLSLKAAALDVGRLEAAFAALSFEKFAPMVTVFRTQLVGAAAALGSMGVEGVAAAAGVSIANAAFTAFRGVMIGLTAIARTMWVAIGGFPGLIITGLTFVLSGLLSEWIGGVDKATAAMEEHDRVMQKVREDYDAAADSADKAAKKFKDLTEFEVLKDLADSAKRAQEALDKLKAPTFLFGKDERESTKQLAAVYEQLRDGKISAEEYRQKVSQIALAFGDIAPEFVQKLLDQAHAFETAKSQGDTYLATLHLMHGTATDADKAILGLANSLGQVNGALDASNINAYNDALDKLGALGGDKKESALKTSLGKAQLDLKTALESLKLSDDQVSKVLKGDLSLGGATKDQVKLASDAYKAFTDTVASIRAQVDHEELSALPTSTSGHLRQRIQKVEGTGQNGRSSAQGLGQFTDQTYLAVFDQVFDKLTGLSDKAKLATRSDHAYADPILDALIKQNQLALAKAGVAVTDATTYLAHFLGAPSATKLLEPGRNPRTSAASLDPEAAAANPEVFYHGFTRKNQDRSHPLTIAELEAWAEKRVGGGAPILENGSTKQEEFDAGVAQFVKSLHDAANAIAVGARDAFIESKVKEEENKAANENVAFTPDQRSKVVSAAGELFDSQAAAEIKKKSEALGVELDAEIKNHRDLTEAEKTLARNAYIEAEAHMSLADLIKLKGGQQYADQLGQKYDRGQNKDAYESVVGLDSQRKTSVGELNNAFKEGDVEKATELKAQIAEITRQIQEALPQARAFALAMGDQKMLATLDKVNLDLAKTKVGLTDVKTVNQQLATGGVGVFDKFVDSIENASGKTGKLKDVIRAVGTAFTQFAADFLKHIAEMIVQQELLNLLAKSPIGSLVSNAVNAVADKATATAAATGQVTTSAAEAGAAAFASTAAIPIVGPGLAPSAGASAEATVLATFLPQVTASLAHAGGIIGSPGGMNRSVAPSIFANAVRYHGGGIAGLLPDEVPTILKKNEEVLTESNPRHRFNQGGGSDAQPAARGGDVKIINAFDHAQVLSEALNTTEGQRAIVNFVRQNPRSINAALGNGGNK